MGNESLFKKGVNRKKTNCYKWQGENVNYSFSIADSDYETCPEIKKALMDKIQSGVIGYDYVDSSFYDHFSKWCKKRYHYEIKNDQIVSTPGVVNSLYFIISMFSKENDAVVINTPVYNPFYDVVIANNRKLLINKMKRYEINENEFSYKFDFVDLEEKIKEAKIYILCNPHNPIGRCYTMDELKRIVELCKKYDTILVSDEIHCDIIMNGNTFTSVANFLKEYQNIIITTAISKTFNLAGLFFSNIIFGDDEMKKTFEEKYHQMSITTNTLGAIAAEVAYTKCAKYVDEQNNYLTENKQIILDFVKEQNIKMAKLEGTYLVWLDLTKLNLSQEELMNKLSKLGLKLNSGTIYDNDAVGYVRFNIACGRQLLIDGLNELRKIL